MNLFLNRHGEYLGYGPEAAELVGIPEPETFMQLPWDKRVARMWCTLFRNREEREDPGAFLTADAAATFAASTTSSRRTTGCSSATAPSRR